MNRARLDALKAQRAAVRAAAEHGCGGGSGATTTTSSSVASAKVTLLSPVKIVHNEARATVRVESTHHEGGTGAKLVSETNADDDFKLSPVTDGKGLPQTVNKKMSDGSWENTGERKPFEVHEVGVSVLKMSNYPAGPAPGMIHTDLVPGATLTIKGCVLHNEWKVGTTLSGTFSDVTVPPAKTKLLELEAPGESYELLYKCKTTAGRNAVISTETGGFSAAWTRVGRDEPTKTSITAMVTSARKSLLSNGGAGIASIESTSGDPQWNLDVTSFNKKLTDSYVYSTTAGLGLPFETVLAGPTIIAPLAALTLECQLDDDLPGQFSKAMTVMDTEQPLEPDDLPFFELGMITPANYTAIVGKPRNPQGRANGGPWLCLFVNAYVQGLGATTDVVSLDTQPFKLMISLSDMPALVGSNRIDTITNIAKGILPLCDKVISFTPNLKDVAQNPKAAETFDARFESIDFLSGLTEIGISLDVKHTLAAAKGWDLAKEEREIASTLTSAAKHFLACGFVLLNENLDARGEGFLETQRDTVARILDTKERVASVSIEMRALNPWGFEEHKASHKELTAIEDPAERVAKIGSDWLVYAIIVIKDSSPPAPSAPPGDDTDVHPKAKKAKKK